MRFFERDNKGIRLRIAGQAVVSVVDRDKADAERGNIFSRYRPPSCSFSKSG